MCQQIIQFCSGSTKPLVFTGSCLSLLLAIGLGYWACSANSLYQDIDPSIAQSRSLTYHLQLVSSAYLILISVLACFAAHYDQKHSIRALAALTSLNFLLAVAAILLIPAADPKVFEERLIEGSKNYDFKSAPQALQTNSPPSGTLGTSEPSVKAAPLNRTRRMIFGDDPTTAAAEAIKVTPLNITSATKLWDDLQYRGCCGFRNYTDWNDKLPKSCCLNEPNKTSTGEYFCRPNEPHYQLPCIELIESLSISTKNIGFLLTLALIALVNLYLANVTGISAYRTFHYNEASQSAYS